MEKPIFFYHQYIAFLVIVCAAVSHGRPYSQPEPSYLKFVLNATEFPSEEYYDYIVSEEVPLVAHWLHLCQSPIEFFFLNEVGLLMRTNSWGSSAINAGFYSRADPDFFRKSGLDWDLRLVNQSYDWVEKAIVFRPDLRNWQSAVRDGFLEAGSKITAIGVVFRDQRGQYHHAMLHEKGEVILSAGAIGSPQLLLLSGIGPRPYLSSWGIPVAYHLPHVGLYLYDNPRNGVSFVPSIPLEHSLIQVVGITELGAYLEAASNVIPFTPPARSVFIRPASALFILQWLPLWRKSSALFRPAC
ncbi:hypothetical protein GH714_010985 [Hevea brasiliensis]|uniref:Glucose-methanol-choline oxidoreductase N-terminal domain-containing protein n=1 Tax=Hevea brasiliensis TaxID=3981 RepID=A0A6A6LR43_HEVBR|nr:hypothetical protein GH714_010985 [Hevea brasiliensis]